MAVPNLTAKEVEDLIPNCVVIGNALKGGQKLVYPCKINGENLAVKFILLADGIQYIDKNLKEEIVSTVARAKREILIMNQINSPHVVKLGSLQPKLVNYNGQLLLYYTEEWIEGSSLAEIISKYGKLPYKEVIKLCLDVNKAISALQAVNKIHRDIKPANIARRKETGEYVLLDMGLAFDLEDKSLTKASFIVGTPSYFSPEQLNVLNKRAMDFRSDIFSLGIVAYLAISGVHPFYNNENITQEELMYNIAHKQVESLSDIDQSIPKEVSKVICRMLNKHPNQRFKSCALLEKHLRKILQKEE